jgi:hypothetical protein
LIILNQYFAPIGCGFAECLVPFAANHYPDMHSIGFSFLFMFSELRWASDLEEFGKINDL